MSSAGNAQEHNFGLNSEGLNSETIQKEKEAPLGPDERERKMGRSEEVSLLIQLGGLKKRRELSQLGPGGSPAKKRFYCNLIADRLC